MHSMTMRTSVTLDDDIYEIASIYANARDITLGAALGELIRKARDTGSRQSDQFGIEIAEDGFPVFRSRGKLLTSEMVKEAQEDDVE